MNYTIIFYVPVDACDAVKQAVFAAGAGAIGDYDYCSWQVLGQGQFRPLLGSNPVIGEHEKLTRVDEYRVEMVCAEDCLKDAIKSMKQAHPYEEVAYYVTQHVTI